MANRISNISNSNLQSKILHLTLYIVHQTSNIFKSNLQSKIPNLKLYLLITLRLQPE
jgi:hypothetical protein